MSTAGSRPATEVRARLQQALRAALQARDTVAVSALRSADAALGNAEAVTPPATPARGGHPHVAGSVEGVGATKTPRRVLSEAQAGDIIRAEIADRLHAANLYERIGHADRAARLRREASALAAAMASGTRKADAAPHDAPGDAAPDDAAPGADLV